MHDQVGERVESDPKPQSVPSRFRLRLTRMGLHFVFVAIFAMAGGAIRGFNLLLALAGFLVAALLIQWRVSRRAVETLTVARNAPDEVHAGRAFRVWYQIGNVDSFSPVWMIRVDDSIGQAGSPYFRTVSCAVGSVGAKATESTYHDCSVARRGRYLFGPIELVTCFPFALINATARCEMEEELYVYPRLVSLRADWQRRLFSHRGGAAVTVNQSTRGGEHFFGLRDWQSGDNPRQVHWRTSARVETLAVRQFTQENRFDVCILVDAVLCESPHESEAANWQNDSVELAISIAATIFVQLSQSNANRIIVACAGKTITAQGGDVSEDVKRGVLKSLAAVSPVPTPNLCDAIERASSEYGESKSLVVISPRSMSQALGGSTDSDRDNDLVRLIGGWQNRSAFRWIDASDPSTREWASMSPDVEVTRAAKREGNSG